jgi:hypothetical protein
MKITKINSLVISILCIYSFVAKAASFTPIIPPGGGSATNALIVGSDGSIYNGDQITNLQGSVVVGTVPLATTAITANAVAASNFVSQLSTMGLNAANLSNTASATLTGSQPNLSVGIASFATNAATATNGPGGSGVIESNTFAANWNTVGVTGTVANANSLAGTNFDTQMARNLATNTVPNAIISANSTNAQMATLAAAVKSLGVLSSNICFISQSMGTVTPAVGDINNPFLSAQSAINACPTNGGVYWIDGILHENVVVTNSQYWFANDGVSLDGFGVQPSAVNFAISGLGSWGTFGLTNGAGTQYISNNFTALKIKCKNFYGGWTFATTNVSTIDIIAEGIVSGNSFWMPGTNQENMHVSANYITNLSLTPTITNGMAALSANKNVTFDANRTIWFSTNTPTTLSDSITNYHFKFKGPDGIYFYPDPSVNKGNIHASGGTKAFFNSTWEFVGSKLFLNSAAAGTTNIFSSLSTGLYLTNEITFRNCQLALGTIPFSFVSKGHFICHYVGCVNQYTNYFSETNVVNAADNTLVDPTWTNTMQMP